MMIWIKSYIACSASWIFLCTHLQIFSLVTIECVVGLELCSFVERSDKHPVLRHNTAVVALLSLEMCINHTYSHTTLPNFPFLPLSRDRKYWHGFHPLGSWILIQYSTHAQPEIPSRAQIQMSCRRSDIQLCSLETLHNRRLYRISYPQKIRPKMLSAVRPAPFSHYPEMSCRAYFHFFPVNPFVAAASLEIW